MYPRHRWVGADVALDQFGLMESVHGLASATYMAMLENWGPSSYAERDSAENLDIELPEAAQAADEGHTWAMHESFQTSEPNYCFETLPAQCHLLSFKRGVADKAQGIELLPLPSVGASPLHCFGS